MTAPPIVVVGAGVAGLALARELALGGHAVDVLALGAFRRGPAASSGRFLVAVDDVDAQLADARSAAAGTADEAAIAAMVRSAPAIAGDLARLGVPLARAASGALALVRGVGHAADRLAHADGATGVHVVRALDLALRRAVAGGARVRRFEGWELLALPRDAHGRVVGVVAQDLRSMEVRSLAASAVVLAAGGFAGAWAGASTALGGGATAIAAAARAGALVVDADRLDRHPIALAPAGVPGLDKPVPLPDVLRAIGARVWLPRDAADRRRPADVPARDRLVVLEGGDRAPHRGEAARALAEAIAGQEGGPGHAWLDATHLGAARIADHLGGAATAVERLAGGSLAAGPVPVAPCVHATLGGLAVERARGDGARHGATTVPGLFAIGGAAASPTGSARLAGHRLLAALFDAREAAGAVAAWADADGAQAAAGAASVLDRAAAEEEASYDRVVAREVDPGSPIAEEVTTAVGEALGRAATGASDVADELDALAHRAAGARCSDRSPLANRGAPAVRRLDAALLLARVVAATARARGEAGGRARLSARVAGSAVVVEREAASGPARGDLAGEPGSHRAGEEP